jgi:putative transposase
MVAPYFPAAPPLPGAQTDVRAPGVSAFHTGTIPIESTFSTVRPRTRVTKGAGSRAAGLAMAFKLIESAQQRWRAVNGPHLVALVRAGATFERGGLIERPN